MYSVKIIYDTGDSFHRTDGVEEIIRDISWTKLEKAKQALRDIQAHYHLYMILYKEWNVDKADKEKAIKFAKSQPWYHTGERERYDYFYVMLENDDGDRVKVYTASWCGFFESLVGADIVLAPEDGFSFRR